MARKWTKMTGNCKEDDLGQGFSTIAAVLAWGLPAAHTIAVLVTRDVDADELTASCFVGQQNTQSLLALVLAPQFAYLSFGVTFLLVGLASLILPRRPSVMPVTSTSASSSSATAAATSTTTTAVSTALTASHATNPLMRQQREMSGKSSPAEIYRQQKELLIRVGIFACLYAVLIICLVSTTFYEWWGRETWLRAPEPSAAPRIPARPVLQFFILRLVVTLGAGILASAWIWWPEVASVCRRLSRCKQPPYKCYPVSVVHCYNPNTASSVPRQIHHLSHLTPPQHPLLQHQHAIANSQMNPHRNYKKYRKHRKHHSGSETQV